MTLPSSSLLTLPSITPSPPSPFTFLSITPSPSFLPITLFSPLHHSVPSPPSPSFLPITPSPPLHHPSPPPSLYPLPSITPSPPLHHSIPSPPSLHSPSPPSFHPLPSITPSLPLISFIPSHHSIPSPPLFLQFLAGLLQLDPHEDGFIKRKVQRLFSQYFLACVQVSNGCLCVLWVRRVFNAHLHPLQPKQPVAAGLSSNPFMLLLRPCMDHQEPSPEVW